MTNEEAINLFCFSDWIQCLKMPKADLERIVEAMSIVGKICINQFAYIDWELVEADRDGRCVVLPKDGMVYYIEEAGGEKWIANKPIQQITVKCGWGIASLEFSLLDTGKWFTREAAETALKGEYDG